MPLTGIHHVCFRVTDLGQTEAFAHDFGLLTVSRDGRLLVMKTRGGDPFCYVATRSDAPGFDGFGFAADSADDLDSLVAAKGSTPVSPLDLPGGGRYVSFTDPDGFAVRVVAGSQSVEPAGGDSDMVQNTPSMRSRHGDTQIRRKLGPAHLYRLGHIGLFVRSFAASAAWYGDTLGLIGSDIYHVPGMPQMQIVGFMRVDRGDEWVDHHVVALMQREQPDCHHISFEVQDFEAQFVAHRWLESRGYQPVWGVGRHPHGSHVFDVWRDPDSYRFETFSDTDLLNASRQPMSHDISTVQLDVWSSDPPDRYFT